MKDAQGFEMTSDEFTRVKEAFKDEEFRKLFAEYAKEIADPESRKKNQEEIAHLEAGQDAGVAVIHPKPHHVIKMRSTPSAGKVFVNICSSDVVDIATSAETKQNKVCGHKWSVPHCTSHSRSDADKSGEPCQVFDVTFNENALALADKSAQFKSMLHSIAMDAVEKRAELALDRSGLKVLKLAAKGTPEVLIHRQERCATKVIASRDTSPACEQVATPKEGCNAHVPQHTIVYRHHQDWQDFAVNSSSSSTVAVRPREIEVRVLLPGKDGAAGIDLEITKDRLVLACQEPSYELDIALPYPVDDGLGRARFDKATKMLHVTLPVFVSDHHSNQDPSALSCAQAKANISNQPPDSAAQMEDCVTRQKSEKEAQQQQGQQEQQMEQQQQQQQHPHQLSEEARSLGSSSECLSRSPTGRQPGEACNHDDGVQVNKQTTTRKKKKRKKQKRPRPHHLETDVVRNEAGGEEESSSQDATTPETTAAPWEVADLPEVVRTPPFVHRQTDTDLSFVIDVGHPVALATISVGFHSKQAFLSLPCEVDDYRVAGCRDGRSWSLLLDFDLCLDADNCLMDIDASCITLNLQKHRDCHGNWTTFRAGSGNRTLKEMHFDDGNALAHPRDPRDQPDSEIHQQQPQMITGQTEEVGACSLRPGVDVPSSSDPDHSDVMLLDLVDEVIAADDDATDDDDTSLSRRHHGPRSILKRSTSEDSTLPDAQLPFAALGTTPHMRSRTVTGASDACINERTAEASEHHDASAHRRRAKSVSFDSLSTVHEFQCLSGKEWKRQMKSVSVENISIIKALTKTKIVAHPTEHTPPRPDAHAKTKRVTPRPTTPTGSSASSADEERCHGNGQGGHKQRRPKNPKHKKKHGKGRATDNDTRTSDDSANDEHNNNNKTGTNKEGRPQPRTTNSVTFANAMIYELED